MRIESLHEALAYFPDIDGYWQASDLPATEAAIIARLETPASSDDAVELLTQLSRAQALGGKMPEARVSLDRAQKIISESSTKPRSQLRYLLEQGRYLCLSMNPVKAHDVFAQAWTMATEADETFFAIDAALMLSTIRPPKFQNAWLQKALVLAEAARDDKSRLWLAHLFLLCGWHAFDTRLYDKALEFFDSALKQPLVANSGAAKLPLQWSRSRALRALGRVPEALEVQQTLLNTMRDSGKISGHIYLEIAECHQLLEQKAEAKANFELAHAALSLDGWYADNRVDELSRMKYLSKKN